MSTWKKAIVAVFAGMFGLALLLAAVMAISIWRFNRWPFDLAKLDGLSDRTTMREVRQTLGEPAEVYTHADESGQVAQEWVYIAPGAWPAVHVRFDADGTYASHDCDY